MFNISFPFPVLSSEELVKVRGEVGRNCYLTSAPGAFRLSSRLLVEMFTWRNKLVKMGSTRFSLDNVLQEKILK